MAYTARKEAECKEFFDEPDVLAKKIKKLAKLVKESKHFCAFTGAGISTAAGIADFRSGINTVLDTGAGKWAKEAAVKEGKKDKIKAAKKRTDSFKAIPTKAHMALVGLMTQGPKYLKYLISQNTDGLHRRSGIPIDQLSELHGNRTMEVCQKCGKEYMRDYRCRKSLRKQKSKDHWTGRFCTVPKCGGKLHDTIVNFGESLPEEPLSKGQENSNECDLMLSLGSSLTVTPAADMPRDVGKKWKKEVKRNKTKTVKHNLCIVNLQETPLDDLCSVRIFAKIDDVMIGLMKELEMEIPSWNLNRFVKVKVEEIENRKDLRSCTISGVDIDGINATVFTGVKLRNNGQKLLKINNNKVVARLRSDEYTFNIPSKLDVKEENGDDNNNDDVNDANADEKQQNDDNDDSEQEQVHRDKGLVVELAFYGHYKEPNLLIQLNEYLNHLQDKDGEIVLRLVFDLELKKWIVKGKEAQIKDEDIGRLWKEFNESDLSKE